MNKFVVMGRDLNKNVMTKIFKMEMDAIRTVKLNQDGHVLAVLPLKRIHAQILFLEHTFKQKGR